MSATIEKPAETTLIKPAPLLRCPPKALSIDRPGNVRTRYIANIPADHPLEAVLSPHYFGELQGQKQLQVRDLIEIEWEDMSKFGELQVRACLPAINQLITSIRIPVIEVEIDDLPAGWGMEYRNPQLGWAITFEGAEKEAGFPSQEACQLRIEALDRMAKTSIPQRLARKGREVEA